MDGVNGLHHITAIAGPAQENLDFYAGILGMRLVKKSVNQDDPGTYHLFYADAEGHPGSDLTFFPWAEMAPPRIGYGLAVEVALEVPVGSLEFWGERLQKYSVPLGAIETRFGDRLLPIVDPHGLKVALVEPRSVPARAVHTVGRQQRAARAAGARLYGAQVWEREAEMTEPSSPMCSASIGSARRTASSATDSRARRRARRPRNAGRATRCVGCRMRASPRLARR
jgi:glyoxalase family protein